MAHEPLEKWEKRRRRQATRRVDIKGVRSGSVVGVEPVARTRFGCIVWLCQCDCGDTIRTVGSLILSGQVKCCGRHCPFRPSRKVAQ
jgi:hypothetical protein